MDHDSLAQRNRGAAHVAKKGRPPAAAYFSGFTGAAFPAGVSAGAVAALFLVLDFFAGAVVSTSDTKGHFWLRTWMELNLSKLPSAFDSKPSRSANGRSKHVLNKVALYHLRLCDWINTVRSSTTCQL